MTGSVSNERSPLNGNVEDPDPSTDADEEEINLKSLDLSFCEKIAIASGHILNDLCAALWYSYVLLFFENIVGLSSNYAAVLVLLGHIADGICTTLVGYEADHTTHFVLFRKSYGRCKTWHLFGVILVALSFPFTFSPCIGCEETADWAKLIYYAPIIAFSQIGWASTQISHLALIPKMNPDELIRTEILAKRYAFTVMSNITIFGLAYAFFGIKDGQVIDSSYASSFQAIVLIAVGIGLVFSLIFHLVVKEHTDEYVKRCHSLCFNSERSPPDSGLTSPMHENEITASNSRSQNVKILARNISRENDDFDDADIPRSLLTQAASDSDLVEEDNNHRSNDKTFVPHPSRSSFSNRPIRRPRTRTVSFGLSVNNYPAVQGEGIVDFALAPPPVTGPKAKYSLSTRYLSLGRENMKSQDWLVLPQYWIVTVIYTMTRLSVNVTQVYVPLYLQNTLKLGVVTVATVPLTMYFFSFIMSFLMKTINRLVGRQFAYIFGALLTLSGSICILTLQLEGSDNYGIYGVAALIGSGASVLLVTSLSITADLIGNNVESGAFVYGTISFSDKLSCGLAVMLINSMVPCQKDDDLSCTPSARESMAPFYKWVLALSSGGCASVGVLFVIVATCLIFIRRQSQSHRRRDEYQEIPSSN